MDVIAPLLSIFVIILACRLAYIAAGRKLVLTPVSVYLVLYIIFHYPLLFQIDVAVIEYSLAINIGIGCFAAGAYVVGFRNNPVHLRRYMLGRQLIRSPDRVVMTVFLLGVLVSFLFYRGLPPSFSILVDALSGRNVFDQLLGMSEARRELTKAHYFGGGYAGQGALKLLNEMVWQLFVVLVFLRAIKTGEWVYFYVGAIVGAIFVLGVGAKGPVAYIAIAVLVARTYTHDVRSISIVRYAVLLLSCLFAIQALQVSRFVSGEKGFFLNVVEAFGRRLIAGNGLNTYYIVELIERGVLHFQNGNEHFVHFMNALPGVQYAEPYAHKLFWAISEGAASDKLTYASYTFVGGGYLDFGYLGVAIVSCVAGLVLQKTYVIMSRFRWTTFNVAFASMFTVHLGELVAGSLASLPATFVAAGIIYVLVQAPQVFFSDKPTRRLRHSVR